MVQLGDAMQNGDRPIFNRFYSEYNKDAKNLTPSEYKNILNKGGEDWLIVGNITIEKKINTLRCLEWFIRETDHIPRNAKALSRLMVLLGLLRNDLESFWKYLNLENIAFPEYTPKLSVKIKEKQKSC